MYDPGTKASNWRKSLGKNVRRDRDGRCVSSGFSIRSHSARSIVPTLLPYTSHRITIYVVVWRVMSLAYVPARTLEITTIAGVHITQNYPLTLAPACASSLSLLNASHPEFTLAQCIHACIYRVCTLHEGRTYSPNEKSTNSASQTFLFQIREPAQ